MEYSSSVSNKCEDFQTKVFSLINALNKILIFNLYYSFDRIRDNENVLECKGQVNKVLILKKMLEKGKKNIEKCLDLCFLILKTLEGDKSLFIQYVLENYCSINFNTDENNQNKDNKHKKFSSSFFMYHLHNNLLSSKENKLIKDIEVNIKGDNNNNKVSMNVAINNEQMCSYIKNVSTIDKYINKNELYTRDNIILQLNSLLNDYYLQGALPSNLDKEQINITREKKKKMNDDDIVINNLFSEYFNTHGKDKKLNIFLKEVNMDNLTSFHNILYKNINFFRTFNAERNNINNMNNLGMSTIFRM
ncbi:conserved protein, unknown function [Hepatocystis sp. ex Piliocolobus tephrosceles]|nr:conserved protein, unknown function [Hepatocystis sp. ex Piliocolobus tephrosceles]